MKIIPEKCTFIVNGAWNTAIIQPKWLRSQFPTLIPDKFDILFLQDISKALRFDIKNIYFEPRDNCLIFIPKKVDDTTLDFISELSKGIQKKLPFTPVLAAGCNFTFELDNNEQFTIKNLNNMEDSELTYEPLKLDKLVAKETRHTFSFSDYRLNIIYNINADKKSILYNYHCDRNSPVEFMSESLKDNYNSSVNLNKKLIEAN
ncbi:MAG: hypothetical protein ACUZ8E_18455 [Candidatus Anammoxibacter sp.]